jgi:endonuclease YncB( thermonuclease family)
MPNWTCAFLRYAGLEFGKRASRAGVLVIAAAAATMAIEFGASAVFAQSCTNDAEAGEVAAIEDARTVRLADGRTLRLAGIEPIAALFADPNAADGAASVLVSSLARLVGTDIRFQLLDEKPDRYGRGPALVVADGRLLQEDLVGEGLAVAFAVTGPIPCFEKLLAAEDEARKLGRGFWAGAALPFAIPENLAQRTGLLTIFEGNVLTVGNRASRTYLNFGRRWSDDVTAEILAADRDAFGGEEGLSKMAGRRVRVRGVVADRNGPLVTVRSPMQIEILPQTGRPIGPYNGVAGEAP